MKLWLIAALVAAGIVVGTIMPGTFTGFFRYATFYVFLPAIIFEAAWQLDFRVMQGAWRPIVLLALPGVFITAAVIAGFAYFGGRVAAAPALILGAVLSATDPIAVTAIFRRLRVPRRLATIVESEALLNDAIAVVLFRAVIAGVVAAAAAQRLAPVAIVALLGSILGLLTGAVFGYAASFALRRKVPMALQLGASFVAAYGAYFAADRFGWSGIFAVIACAIVMRALERNYASVELEQNVEAVWHGAAAISNGILFFLIGAAVQLSQLWVLRFAVFWTLAGVLLSRAILGYGLVRLTPRMTRSWVTVVRLAGVRGAISLALALSISAGIPQRDVVIDATFAVVIVTILIGSLTYGRWIASLDLASE